MATVHDGSIEDAGGKDEDGDEPGGVEGGAQGQSLPGGG